MDLRQLDLSQTQRIFFFVDLHSLFHSSNPSSSYIASVLAAARTLLSFPAFSSSLFAFKLFFSSLSPLLSSSLLNRLLPNSPSSSSFDRPSQTLVSLSNALSSFSQLSLPDQLTHPNASYTAQSLLQLAHHYIWDHHFSPDPNTGTPLHVLPFRSNLLLLFSPFPRSLKFLDSQFHDLVGFSQEFRRVFGSVNEGFVARDIHLCWVDVNFVDKEPGDGLQLIESAIKGLGWSLCSTDAIALGSTLVPFGLIYPHIGFSVPFMIDDQCKARRAELSLVISDVNGQPLECKYCDLELLDLKHHSRGRSVDLSQILECVNLNIKSCERIEASVGDATEAFPRDVGSRIMKIHLKKVWKAASVGMKIEGRVCNLLLLRGFSAEHGKDQKRETCSGGVLADKVLEMLRMETTEFTAGKPAWQLLLSFLYKESYWATVSVSVENGNSVMGILMPFMIHSAILYITDSKLNFDSISSGLSKLVNEKKIDVIEADDGGLNCSQSSTCSYSMPSGAPEGKRKRNKKHSDMLKCLTWCSFRNAVLGLSSEGTNSDFVSEMDLEAVYFSRQSNNSKKFRFLKCWMKQIKICGGYKSQPNEQKTWIDVEKETEERTISSQQESEEPISSSLCIGEPSFHGSTNDQNPTASVMETLETFSESISCKIQQGLESEDVNLGLLAERMVYLSIHWLSVNLEKNGVENLISEKPEATCYATIFTELERLLLSKPRDLAAKYRGCNPSSLESDLTSSVYTSEQKVREHELQILFRMEILQSKASASIEEPSKHKMVKEICSLLENIEFNLQGGMFGGESLVDFAGRTIKTRYAYSLGDVIHRIYSQMEFLSQDDEDDDNGEASGSIPNSFDNGEHRAEEENDFDGNAGGRTIGNSEEMNRISTEDSPNSMKDDLEFAQTVGDTMHKHKLIEAQERRERAGRLAPLTRSLRELQRVWAPKQPKVQRRLKSKSRRRTSGTNERRGGRKEIVCETPMVGTKRAYEHGNSGDRKHLQATNSCGSVSKALFCGDEEGC